jgi:hypothetical protein
MRSQAPEAGIALAYQAILLRIIMIFLDAYRIEEDTHAEFDHATRGQDFVP